MQTIKCVYNNNAARKKKLKTIMSVVLKQPSIDANCVHLKANNSSVHFISSLYVIFVLDNLKFTIQMWILVVSGICLCLRFSLSRFVCERIVCYFGVFIWIMCSVYVWAYKDACFCLHFPFSLLALFLSSSSLIHLLALWKESQLEKWL